MLENGEDITRENILKKNDLMICGYIENYISNKDYSINVENVEVIYDVIDCSSKIKMSLTYDNRWYATKLDIDTLFVENCKLDIDKINRVCKDILLVIQSDRRRRAINGASKVC